MPGIRFWYLPQMVLLLCSLIATAPWQSCFASNQEEIGLKEVTVAKDAFSRGVPPPRWVTPVAIPPATRHDAVVVRLADSQLRVGQPNVAYIQRAMQVNDVSALSQIGQIQLSFVPQYQKLRLHRVALLRGEEILDQTQSVNIRFLQRETGLENNVYSGAVTVSLLLSDVRVGDTLVVSYSIEGSNPVFGDMYVDGAGWELTAPIELRNVTLTYPSNRKMYWKMLGDFHSTAPPAETRAGNGYKTIQWKEQGIEAITLEENVPNSYLPFRFLQFSEYSNWNEVARWADTLFPPPASLPEELQKLIGELKKLPNDEERTKQALQWVQREIRYFSVSLGENAQRPYPPTEVVKRRFGDCKDKAYLLVSILRALGIEAKPVLVSIQAPKVPEKVLPTPDFFDHAVVQVKLGEKFYYLDGTRLGQEGQLSKIGSLPDGTLGLVVAPDTKELTKIRADNGSDLNTIELAEHFSIPSFSGKSTLISKTTWHGTSAEFLRLALKQLTPDQQYKFFLSNYEQRYPGIALNGKPEISDDLDNNALTISTNYSIPNFASDYNGSWFIKFRPYTFRGFVNVPKQLSRNFPIIAMSYPLVNRYNVTVDWPPEVSVLQDPRHQHTTNDFFEFEAISSFRGNVFTQQVVFKSKTDSVSPKDIASLVEALNKFDKAILTYASVEPDEIKSSGPLGLNRTTLQENMRKQFQTTVDRTSKVIASGRLTGEDLAEAYCDRAEAYGDLGKVAEGREDAAEAIHIAPQLSRSWKCRAYINLVAGEFPKAIADYSKALSLGGNAFDAYERRGNARFYLGKLSDAADDFAKAINSTDDEADQLYASLWLAWTLKKLNRPFPADLTERAAKNPHGAWPRPALAMLTSLITPEQMLAEVNKKQGDERELTLVEAYFYLAQYYRNNGQPALAEDYFRKTREKGITAYIEHTAAGFELKAADENKR